MWPPVNTVKGRGGGWRWTEGGGGAGRENREREGFSEMWEEGKRRNKACVKDQSFRRLRVGNVFYPYSVLCILYSHNKILIANANTIEHLFRNYWRFSNVRYMKCSTFSSLLKDLSNLIVNASSHVT